MDEPKSLDSLFKQRILRIPDYQRGYAWQREQLKDFWEDLVNLADDRAHYTGVLTLKRIRKISPEDKEYWLVEDHSYEAYEVVDGQQRLTTFVIFLQAFVDFLRHLPEFRGKSDSEIYVTESLNVAALQANFLFKVKPTGDRFRTYKFGYTVDNPSYEYLRFRILDEEGGGNVEETFYTLNLSNAKTYFTEQFRHLHAMEQLDGLQRVYKKITKRFLFNEYVIKDEFDVFVAFETMNNRGKKLSDLELLKNRLIYLTTLYSADELDDASRSNLRETINGTWKEIYHQLGRNKTHPLNDDEFLRAHWIMYFKYSRKSGKDYIRFLLDEQFAVRRVHVRSEREVALDEPQETLSDEGSERAVDDDEEREVGPQDFSHLKPTEIRDYVHSLKASAVYWFNSFYPELAPGVAPAERLWIDRLNRVGISYFRPLVMSNLKNEPILERRLQLFERIERFIFIVFRMNSYMGNYRSSEFYNAARDLDRDEIDIGAICDQLKKRLEPSFNDDGSFRIDDFQNELRKRFENETGYYTWPALRYFLFEYESSLLSKSRQQKISWNDLLKSEKDKVSIEHIYPQTESSEWKAIFKGIPHKQRVCYNSSLGNLILLSQAINSSLQNDKFASKKTPKFDSAGRKLRNGYSDGSHSEIELSQYVTWGPSEIRSRGIKLLQFMASRWDFQFRNDSDRDQLLFLDFEKRNQP